MAVKAHAGMSDQTSSNIARDGAAKRPQTSFPVHNGMKDQTSYSGISPSSPGSGPDGSSPSVLDASAKGKKVQSSFATKWGHRDANGASINGVHSGTDVLSEASRS